MKRGFVMVFIAIFVFFSCKKNHETDLNYIHLKQITKQLENDFNDISELVASTSQKIQLNLKIDNEISWNPSKYQVNQNKTLFVSQRFSKTAVYMPVGSELSSSGKKAIVNTEFIDSLLINICQNNSLVAQSYYLDTNSLLRIYPYFDVTKQYLPTIRLTDFFAFKSLENKPLNSKEGYWIQDPYADPSGRGWIISCLSPVYYREEFIGVISADVMIKSICEKHFGSNSEKFILLNERGEIISCSKKAAGFFNIAIKDDYPFYKPFTSDIFLKGNPSFVNSNKKELRKMIGSVKKGESFVEFFYDAKKVTVYSSRIKPANWLLLKIIN